MVLMAIFLALGALFLTREWILINRDLRRVWNEGRPWRAKDKMKWVALSMLQIIFVFWLSVITVETSLYLAGEMSTYSVVWMTTLIVLAGSLIGIWGHMYGLYVTQRVGMLGAIFWPFLLFYAAVSVDPMKFLAFYWVCTLMVRVFQANRTKAPKGLAQSMPASVFPVKNPD